LLFSFQIGNERRVTTMSSLSFQLSEQKVPTVESILSKIKGEIDHIVSSDSSKVSVIIEEEKHSISLPASTYMSAIEHFILPALLRHQTVRIVVKREDGKKESRHVSLLE